MDDSFTTPFFLYSQLPNVTNQTNVCVFNEEFKFFLLPVSYSTVTLLGLPLNITAMWIFFAKMRPWSPTTVYMFNLALSDSLYLLSLPTLVYYYAAHNNWPFGEVLCKIVRFLFYTNLYCSILFLTCISIHRYIGVCHPLFSLHRMRSRHAHMVCITVWIAVNVCIIPNLIFVTISPRGNDTLCHDTTRPVEFEEYVQYSTSVMSLLFGIPCFVIASCYGLMARELMKPGVNGNRRVLPSYKRRSIRTIIMVVTVFIICFLPFHITRTMYYYARLLNAKCEILNAINFIYKITRSLASANSCFDPVLYFLTSDKYQRWLVSAVTRFSCNACRRCLPVRKQVKTRNKEGSLAVISSEDIQAIGSFGCVLGTKRTNLKEEVAKNIVVNKRNAKQASTKKDSLAVVSSEDIQTFGSLDCLLGKKGTSPIEEIEENIALNRGNNKQASTKMSSLAVILIEDVQAIGSLDCLLEDKGTTSTEEMEEDILVNKKNSKQSSTKSDPKHMINTLKRRITGKNVKEKENTGLSKAEDYSGEQRNDKENIIKGINTVSFSDAYKDIKRKQSNFKLERKTDEANKERIGSCSSSKKTEVVKSHNETLINKCEEEGSSF